jgi:hypothetical protein
MKISYYLVNYDKNVDFKYVYIYIDLFKQYEDIW